jgi:hypothetical protein
MNARKGGREREKEVQSQGSLIITEISLKQRDTETESRRKRERDFVMWQIVKNSLFTPPPPLPLLLSAVGYATRRPLPMPPSAILHNTSEEQIIYRE